MKTKFFFGTGVLLFLIATSFSCGGGNSDIVDTLLPDLTATWTNTANPDDTFFFFAATAGAATSSITGNNDFPVNEQHTFSGSYTNSKINFTINDGPRQGTKYTGKISGTAPNATMTLTVSTGGTVTLQQHQ